ncbi:MAG: class I SAM-dependent methyltransferase [Chloroflexota bacterium]
MNDRVFDLLARYYDLEHGEYAEDLPLYLGFAARTGSPVLEVGCGTGRVLMALAEAGHEVTGVDVSAAMLAQTAAKVAARPALVSRVRLIRGDARDLALSERFSLSFWAMNSFMHLPGQADQLRALAVAWQHLREGGLLILDLFHADIALLQEADGRLVHDATWRLEGSGRTVLKTSSRHLDQAEQTLETTYVYDEVDSDGRTARTVASFTIRYLHRFEMQLLLERVGFVVEGLYGSYDLDEFTSDSERMIFVARKGS